jgi:hypothetical protein
MTGVKRYLPPYERTNMPGRFAWPGMCVGLAIAAACATAPRTAIPRPDPDLPAGRLLLLPAPDGGHVAAGALSQDGSRYAYQAVLPDSSVQIWLLDLASLRVRELTSGAGRRSPPAWSPQGTRLAYTRATDGEPVPRSLVVLDVAEGRERAVFRARSAFDFLAWPRWMTPDTLVVDHSGSWPGTPETWLVAADGSGSWRLAGRPAIRYGAGLSPSGSLRAYTAPCCDARMRGLWITLASDISESLAVCRAGPIRHAQFITWTPGDRAVLFAASADDSTPALWSAAVGPAEGPEGAAGVRAPPGLITSVGVGRSGGLAVGLREADGSALLWLVDRVDSLPRLDETLPSCPSLHPRIAAFARAEGLTGRIAVTETFSLPGFEWREFQVAYEDADEDGSRTRSGLDAGGRLGWTGPECRVGRFGDTACPLEPEAFTYRPPSDEPVLWSTPLLARLAERRRDRDWAELLLATPELPAAVIDSLLAAGRYDDLLAADPRVRERVDRLLTMRARNRRGSVAGQLAFEALRERGPALIDDSETPRDLPLEFAARLPAHEPPDSLSIAIARALLQHPELGRDTAVLAHVAAMPTAKELEVVRTAGRRLLADPAVSRRVLRRVATNLAADPDLAAALFDDPRVTENPLTLRSLARSPWDGWRVAERARRVVRERRERERRERAGRVEIALPLVVPGGWRETNGAYYDPWFPLRVPLVRLDPLFGPAPASVGRGDPRADQVRALCEAAADPERREGELEMAVEGAVYATSTALAACLLEVASVRSNPRLLRALATMIDVNHDGRYPAPGEPAIAEIRTRAQALLDDLEAD